MLCNKTCCNLQLLHYPSEFRHFQRVAVHIDGYTWVGSTHMGTLPPGYPSLPVQIESRQVTLVGLSYPPPSMRRLLGPLVLLPALCLSAPTAGSSARCRPSTPTAPVIDLAPLLEDFHSPESGRVVSQIVDAFASFGFFHALHHGAESHSKQAMEAARTFFALPLESKRALERSVSNSRGFTNCELTKRKVDLKEMFDFGHVPFTNLADNAPENRVLDGYNQWPEDEDFQRIMKFYYQRCFQLGHRLLQAVSLGLTSDANALDGVVAKHSSFMRLNYYPPAETFVRGVRNDYSSLGISRHTDAGLLTVLTQGTTPGEW